MEALYASYEALSAATDNISQLSQDYINAIEASKEQGEKEKQLASQIISKFFKHFPSLQKQAVVAIMSLCKDDNVGIRRAAMIVLPQLCKEASNFFPKITSFVANFLDTDDAQQIKFTENALGNLYIESPVTVIKSLCKTISVSTNYEMREKILKFLLAKIKTINSQEADDEMINQMKLLIICCNCDEFTKIMTYLTNSKLVATLAGKKEIIDIIYSRADLDKNFNASDNSNFFKLIICVKFVIPFFSPLIDSKNYLKYYCDQVIPHLKSVGEMPDGEKMQLLLVQQLAQLSTYCGKLETPSVQISEVFAKLKFFLPAPPQDIENKEIPYVSFSIVECLLYTFHKLAAQSPDFLTHDEASLREFRSYLIYLSRIIQGCQKVLNMTGKEKVFSPEEKKIREISPKLLSNIIAIIRNLMLTPPQYNANVTLSFDDLTKAKKIVADAQQEAAPKSAQKRHVPITFDSDSKQGKKVYQPPGGKFSHNFDRKPRFSRGGGGGGGARGTFRNRGNYRSTY